MQAKPLVVVMAGGTGGHVFPALATAEVLQTRGYKIHWLGTQKGIESRLVPAAGIDITYLTIAGVRGKGWKGWLSAPLNIIKAVAQSRRALKQLKPVCVLGMGGFVAAPGGLAARLLGFPLVIHEQNAIAGSTNKFLAKIATRVLQAFPNAFGESGNGVVVGNPIRGAIENVRQNREHDSDGEYKHILVLGGSQGALALNEKVPSALHQVAKEFKLKVRHQSGERGFESVKKAYGAMENIEVQTFINNMAEAYAWADIVICRSGALTVSELAAAGLPSILIPFPYAIDDHQTANAKFLVNVGAAQIMPQATLTQDSLSKALFGLLRDPSKLPKMGDCAISVAKFGVAEKVADVCLECISEY